MKLALAEVQRSIHEALDREGLHGPGRDDDALDHLKGMARSVLEARDRLEDAATESDPGVAADLTRLALFDARDAIVAGYRLLAQHGVPLGRKPEDPRGERNA